MKKPNILILGAGPAGVGAAYQLTKRGVANVTILERHQVVGGNAGSFELAGMRVDYGSHRLHPACDTTILNDIQNLLGDDLLDRPRHGRIRLHGRWIHFPLKPIDLLLRVSPKFAVGVANDLIHTALGSQRKPLKTQTFASVLEAGLGRTICQEFYFPYARKLWGLAPEALSATQAQRRVKANSLGKMIRKVLMPVSGPTPVGSRRFFYPRQGYGQISEAMFRAAERNGARFEFGAAVKSIEHEGRHAHGVMYEKEGAEQQIKADHIWSTLPVTGVVRSLHPPAPNDLQKTINELEYRAMILVYLVLEQNQFTEFDAHYFPESQIPISRLSEPKNYSENGPKGHTVLCAELPCAPHDRVWQMADVELGQLVCTALEKAGIAVRAPVKEVTIRRLRFAYPIYRRGYEDDFEHIDKYLDRFQNLLTFGRQGLFAHDNTHHALAMAYAAVDCLAAEGRFDWDHWHECRRIFETHVVED